MKYLSLFSGIGGFEHGIMKSMKANQFQCIGFSEIDKYAKKIYKKHYPNHPDLGDVTKIKTEDLPDFDFLVGGFPCQAFSVAGKRRGFDDTRGTLFFEIARILKDKRPRYFLLENVKGLLSHDKGKTFQTILRTLSELGYDVQWEIFNSKNHGVPQNRERIYIKGFLTTRRGSGREVLSLRKANPTPKTRQGETTKKDNINCLVRGKGQGSELYGVDGIGPTLICGHAGDTKILIPSDNNSSLIRVNEKPSDKRDKEENRVYSSKGISPTLTATKSNQIKIIVNKTDTPEQNTPHVIGNIYESNHSNGNVYSEEGIAPTLTCSNSDELKINITNEKEEPKINIVGNVYPSGGQAGDVYDTNGLMGTLGLSSQGKGGEGKKILIENEPKINIVGNVSQSGNAQGGNVYDESGIMGTLCAGDIKASKKVLVRNNSNISHDDITSSKIISVNDGHQNHTVYDSDGISPTLTADHHSTKVLIKNCSKKGYLEATDGDGLILGQPNGRGKVQKQRVGTLDTSQGCGAGVLIKEEDIQKQPISKTTLSTDTKDNRKSGALGEYTVRKLTPIETERLQGFPDNWTKEGYDGTLISDTQRYKCCGNAVTTNVIRDIINTWDMQFDS